MVLVYGIADAVNENDHLIYLADLCEKASELKERTLALLFLGHRVMLLLKHGHTIREGFANPSKDHEVCDALLISRNHLFPQHKGLGKIYNLYVSTGSYCKGRDVPAFLEPHLSWGHRVDEQAGYGSKDYALYVKKLMFAVVHGE